MDEYTRALNGLNSICTYCEEIANATHRFGSKESFLTDYAYQATCAFSLQQIGKIVKINYSWLKTEEPKFPWHQYIRFRKFIVRNCEHMDYDVLWAGVCDDVMPIWDMALHILESHYDEHIQTHM